MSNDTTKRCRDIREQEKKKMKGIYGKTRGAYEAQIRGAVRKIWSQSRPRANALKRTRIKNTDITSRKKLLEVCERCGVTHYIGERVPKIKKDGTVSKVKEKCLVVHHIEHIPNVFHSEFLTKMFCEQFDNPADGYLILCQKCHKKIHSGEIK